MESKSSHHRRVEHLVGHECQPLVCFAPQNYHPRILLGAKSPNHLAGQKATYLSGIQAWAIITAFPIQILICVLLPTSTLWGGCHVVDPPMSMKQGSS